MSRAQRRAVAALLVVLAPLLAACGSGTGGSGPPTTVHPGVGTTQPSGVGTTQPSGVGTTQPSGANTTSTTTTSTKAPSTGDDFSGFGATLARWTTTHVRSENGVAGVALASYWGPKTTSASVFTHEFVVLQTARTRVIALEMNFPTGTSLDVAQAAVFSQLPSDTHVTSTTIIAVDANANSCLQMTVRSAFLGNMLAAAPFHDPSGVVSIELATVVSASSLGYRADNINAAFLQLDSRRAAGNCC